MTKDPWVHADSSRGYSYAYRRRRTRTDWAGVGIGDAFKNHLDYYLRMSAQRLFYRTVKKAQAEVARLTGAVGDARLEAKAKPQLGPCYTTYPSAIAAFAAVGLTTFLEFKARVQHNILFLRLADFLAKPAEFDKVDVDPASYKTTAETVASWVQTRLLLTDLSRSRAISSVEIYRLFSASQEDLRFSSLPGIIRAVVLFGDVLPDWSGIDLHPMTRNILADLTQASAPFFKKIAEARGPEFLLVGDQWVRAACRSLVKYLPPPEKETGKKPRENRSQHPRAGEPSYRFGNKEDREGSADRIPPQGGPNPPTLLEPQNTVERVAIAAGCVLRNPGGKTGAGEDENALDKETEQALRNFADAIESAGGQQRSWEDMRSDILEGALRFSIFAEGPISGLPPTGRVVIVKLDGDKKTSGEIFDRAVEVSADQDAIEKLLREANPIAEALRRSLYPNIQQVPETQRIRTSGSLDPGRLPLADFASTVFRRYRIREKADRRGRPVLAIACDGSGSLNANQMKMLKTLAAGWLVSTARSDVQILAGLYHSDNIRRGLSGPLVQWIYHPAKTPSTGRMEAVGALVSLPDSGTGAQSDALSVAFILEEARRIARGSMVYLILLSDTAWNRSFNTEKSGKEEMQCLLQASYEEFKGKLHATLVALGVQGATGFEDLLDAVITVSDGELVNYSSVAEKIGVYVAACMRERRRLIERQ